MSNKPNFSVGPSAIHPLVPAWTQEFYEKEYGSISHRSDKFQELYSSLDAQLKQLMNIPSSHSIFIASSGSELMERILQNCVESKSFHFVNGYFSEKFFNYADRLGIECEKYSIEYGLGFDTIPQIDENTDLICITHNETSTGIKTSEEYIHKVKSQYPNKKIAVDIVSSAPFVDFDYSMIDMCFFSSQKAFGMPAGLGIWVIDNKVAERCSKSPSRGAHNTLVDYIDNYSRFQTPSTPNVLGMYLMNEVAKSYNQLGIETLKNEMMDKKSMFHDIMTNNPHLKLVNDSSESSDTVIVAEFIGDRNEVIDLFEKNSIICSHGYKKYKESQLRFSNFPSNTIEDIQYLKSVLNS